MKKLITIAILASFIQFASAAGSIINLHLENNAPFKVSIDGKGYTPAASQQRIENLTPGKHLIQITSRSWTRGNRERSKGFSNYITVTGNTESFITVFPESNKLKFDRIVALIPNPVIDGCGKAKADDMGTQLPSGSPIGGGYIPGAPITPPVPAGPMAMCNQDFTQLVQTIDKATFESTKLIIFKQALAYNYFTTNQVRTIMNQFTFDSSKLDVAELAYNKTMDQNNYYLVNNNFTFSSSVDELDKYIAMR